MDDIQKWFAEKLESALMQAMTGGLPKKQRQTALRVRGRSFETVELDDDGNVIEPVRCCCGVFAVLHHPRCPFAYGAT